MVYSAEIDGKRHTFGVSGLLWKSNVLLYDRTTGSLWSQLLASAISGKYAGRPLREIPSEMTTWAAWKKAHPGTSVMTTRTGHYRDYENDPYARYYESPGVMFSAGVRDDRLPQKARVFGLVVGKDAKAYPLSALEGPTRTIRDRVGAQDIMLHWDSTAHSVRATDAAGKRPLPGVTVFWFAWTGFHPHTQLYNRPSRKGRQPAKREPAAGSSGSRAAPGSGSSRH